ncbi:MAG: hypothetical protein QM831_24840 [Kofleriaceae bacterium]
MGYDCTLHVIDPASIARFEAWLLDRKAAPKFKKAYTDVDALRDEVLDALATKPRDADRILLQACLMFCATETPHLDSRGFCLGLWDRLGLGIADALPAGSQDSMAIAPLLPRVTEAYPELRLFTGIDGNWAVGHYIPNDRIAAVRAHVEATLDEVTSDWQSALDKVIRVLNVCEKRGLAYWEATDLAVANANEKWLVEKPKKPAKPKKGAVPEGVRVDVIAHDHFGIQYVKDGRAIVGHHDGCVLVDGRGELIVTPIDNLEWWLRSVRELPDGRVMALAKPAIHGMPTQRVGSKLWLFDFEIANLHGQPLPPGWTEISHFDVAGDKVVLFPETSELWKRERAPVYLDGTEIPLPRDVTWGDGSVADFGDGSMLLAVGPSTFRVRGTQVEPLATGKLKVYHLGEPPMGLATDGRLLIALQADAIDRESRFVAITPAGEITAVWPELQNVYPAQPARDGALVLKQYQGEDGDLLKVYWSRSDELTSIPVAWTGQKNAAWSFGFDSVRDELWVTCAGSKKQTTLVRIAWSVIEALPRFTHASFRVRLDDHRSAKAKRHRERTWKAIDAQQDVKPVDQATYIFKDKVVEVDGQRAIVITDGYNPPEFVVEFADGTRRTIKR